MCPVQPPYTPQERLISLYGTLGSWRRVAALFPGISHATLCAVSKGRVPKDRRVREVLGFDLETEVQTPPGVTVSPRAFVLRSSRPCACGCGAELVPNSWNHRYLPRHRKHRKGTRPGVSGD